MRLENGYRTHQHLVASGALRGVGNHHYTERDAVQHGHVVVLVVVAEINGLQRLRLLDQLRNVERIRRGILQAEQQVEETAGLHLVRLPVGAVFVGVEDGGDGAEHLQDEGLPVEQVELLDRVLDGGGDELVRLVQRVDLEQRGHNHEVAIGGEDVLEVEGGVDEGGHHVAHDAGIFGVQDGGAGKDVQEELDVRRVGEITGHGLEHAGDEAHPHELVQDVQPEQHLSVLAAMVQVQIHLECLARKGGQLHQLLVQEHHPLHHHVHVLEDRPG